MTGASAPLSPSRSVTGPAVAFHQPNEQRVGQGRLPDPDSPGRTREALTRSRRVRPAQLSDNRGIAEPLRDFPAIREAGTQFGRRQRTIRSARADLVFADVVRSVRGRNHATRAKPRSRFRRILPDRFPPRLDRPEGGCTLILLHDRAPQGFARSGEQGGERQQVQRLHRACMSRAASRSTDPL